MDVLSDVWNKLLSDMMLWIVGESDRVGLTDEKITAKVTRLLEVVVVFVLR